MHRNHPHQPFRVMQTLRNTAGLELSTHMTPLNAFAAATGRDTPSRRYPYRSDLWLRRMMAVDHPPLAARPKTHQNLIHTDKDQQPGHPDHIPTPNGPLPSGMRTAQTRKLGIPLRRLNPLTGSFSAQPATRRLVEVIGFEPTTPCLQSRCSPS